MTSPAAPPINLSALPEGVSATFTWTCSYGCLVRTIDGIETDHVCVGEQVIGVLAGLDVPLVVVQRIAEGLKPLINEVRHVSWLDGVRDGRGGELLYGVPEDAPKIAAEDVVR